MMTIVMMLQESMGSIHNLFGSTHSVYVDSFLSSPTGQRPIVSNGAAIDYIRRGQTIEDVLRQSHHDPEELIGAIVQAFSNKDEEISQHKVFVESC